MTPEQQQLFQMLQQSRQPPVDPQRQELQKATNVGMGVAGTAAAISPIAGAVKEAVGLPGTKAPSKYPIYSDIMTKIQQPLKEYDVKQMKMASLKKDAKELEMPKRLSERKVSNLRDQKVLVQKLDEIDGVIDKKIDRFGKFKGTLEKMATTVGWADDAAILIAAMKPLQQLYGRLLEGGVLRREDEIKYEKQFPQLTDDPKVAISKIKFIKNMLVARYQEDVKGLNAQRYDITGYEDVLNRKLKPITEEFLFGSEGTMLSGAGKGKGKRKSSVKTANWTKGKENRLRELENKYGGE